MITRTRSAGRRLRIDQLDLDRLGLPALGLAIVASGLLLFHLTRTSSFWSDDWLWIVNRRSGTLHTFLAPYNGHLSLVPIAIYHVLFARFGLTSYTPYRSLVIVLSLVVGLAVFAYAQPRTGRAVAALAAALMLFLGPGWQDTMWAFQIPWLIVCVAGIGALMLLERRSTVADVAASALIVLSIASTSLGVAFALGIIVELALVRRRLRDIWIWAVPLLLYVAWVLGYHPDAVDLSLITKAPQAVAQAAAAAPSVLLGVSGIGPADSTAQAFTYGWPLLVMGAVIAARRVRRARLHPRAVSLVVVFVAFTASTSVVHFGLTTPLASRYLYVDCLLLLLFAIELAAGVRPSPGAVLALAVIVAIAIVGNIGSLRAFGAYIRGEGQATDGALTALDLDRGSANPDGIARIAEWQFFGLKIGWLYSAERALGSPAYSVPELRQAPITAQAAADAQLLADGDAALVPTAGSAGSAGSGTPPVVVASSGGVVASTGACVRLTPQAALPPGAMATLSLKLPAAGVSVSAGSAPVTLSVRRFSPAYTQLGTVAAGRSTTVKLRHDAAPDAWYLQATGLAPVSVCGLSP